MHKVTSYLLVEMFSMVMFTVKLNDAIALDVTSRMYVSLLSLTLTIDEGNPTTRT